VWAGRPEEKNIDRKREPELEMVSQEVGRGLISSGRERKPQRCARMPKSIKRAWVSRGRTLRGWKNRVAKRLGMDPKHKGRKGAKNGNNSGQLSWEKEELASETKKKKPVRREQKSYQITKRSKERKGSTTYQLAEESIKR